MKKYKVLRLKENNDVVSPFQGYNYGKLNEIIEKEFVCCNFDEGDKECSNGFYASDVEGLLYSINEYKDCRVFEVEVGGKSVIVNQFKQRYERQIITRLLTEDEVMALVKDESEKLGYDLYRTIYSFNIGKAKTPIVNEDVLRLLDNIINIRHLIDESVCESVNDSPWESIWEPVKRSVWASIKDSIRKVVLNSTNNFVWDSVWDLQLACTGSIFYNIEHWKYVEYKKGEYPFQCYVDLIELGFMPLFDGKAWKLYAGENMGVVYERKEV